MNGKLCAYLRLTAPSTPRSRRRRCSRPRSPAGRCSRDRSRSGWARSSRARRVLDALVDRQDRSRSPCPPGGRSRAATAGCAARSSSGRCRAMTRSTKSGPGRCRSSAGIVSQRCVEQVLRRRRRAAPRGGRGHLSVAMVSSPPVVCTRVSCVPYSGRPASRRYGYAAARCAQNFTGPSYTIGIEEELMIVDAETLDARQRDRVAARGRRATHDGDSGDIKPELMESVLEIATKPCTNDGRGRRAAARAAPRRCARPPPHARPDDRLGRARTRSRCGRTSGSSPARATAT